MLPQPLSRVSSATPALVLKPFQREDIAALRKYNYRALVANSPGTGKTIICLAAMAQSPEQLTPTLIVAPASVVTNWQREAQKWIPGVKVHSVIDTRSPIPRNAHIYIISWSLLPVRYFELVGLHCKLIIADEAHAAKNEEALRTQALSILARRSPHLLLLTGTPLINRPGEMDALRDLLDLPEGQPFPMIRRLLEDVVPEIPPKTRSTLPITLRKKDAAEYERAEEDFADWLETELARRMSHGEALATAQKALAAEALVKTGYLRRLLGQAKVYAAGDWVARAVRLGEPVVVFAEHREAIERIQTLLKRQRIGFVTIEGSVGRGDRQKAIDLFQAGKVPVFIGSKAAATGITLTRAKHLLFAERYYTSAEEEQAEDRIRRIGQTHPTTIWFLHATGTIDDRITTIIEAKREMVRKAIGSADTPERDEDAAVELIASWGDHAASPFKGAETDLGHGKPLPPLPVPHDVCALSFKGPKWTPASVRAWAALHGFKSEGVLQGGVGSNTMRLTTNPPGLFLPGKFYASPISADIQAILGIRRLRSTRSVRPAVSKRKGT